MERRRCRRMFVVLAAFFVSAASGWAATPIDSDLFNDAVVQDIRLSVADRYWNTLKANADLNTYYPADLTWNGIVVRNVGIRSRGSGSRSGIKPGLHVDFNHYVNNQTFLGLTALDLKNVYQDPTALRERLATKIQRRIGLPAPREAPARLFLNNQYAGAYVVVESVDRPFVARWFGAPEADSERGGFLYEFKWRFVWGFEYLGSGLKPYAEMFEPQTRTTDSISNLFAPIEEMIRAANETADQDFLRHVGVSVDLQEFTRVLAVDLFNVEWDGPTGNWGANNFFFYRFRDGRPSQFIPWDRDHSFIWDYAHAVDWINASITARFDQNVLARRLMQDASLHQLFIDTLNQCVAIATEPAVGDPRGWLEREVERTAAQIAGSVAADPFFPFAPDVVQSDLDFLRLFAQIRPGIVSCQIAQTEYGMTCQ
jgi:spore coat protein CotH